MTTTTITHDEIEALNDLADGQGTLKNTISFNDFEDMVYDLFEGEREMSHADYELWLTA